MEIDTTITLEDKRLYRRGEFPEVDLDKWLTKEQTAKVRVQQSEYIRLLAEKRV